MVALDRRSGDQAGFYRAPPALWRDWFWHYLWRYLAMWFPSTSDPDSVTKRWPT